MGKSEKEVSYIQQYKIWKLNFSHSNENIDFSLLLLYNMTHMFIFIEICYSFAIYESLINLNNILKT